MSEVPVSGYSTPSTHPALQTGSRPARADDFWSDSSLAPSRSAVKNHRRTIAQLLPGATLTLGRVFLRSQRSPDLRRCLGFALQPLPRVTAGAAQARAAAAARVRQYCHGSGSSRCRTSSKTPPQTLTTGFRTGADVRPPCPCRTLNLGALTLGAPARAQAQALPAQYASILYCRPIEWTPGGEGFEGAACAAGSDYHVFVPSKGYRVGCSPLPAAAYGPHQGAHPRRADRSIRALRGACAGWHVGGDPGLPSLGPELRAGLRHSGPRLDSRRAGAGVGVRPAEHH